MDTPCKTLCGCKVLGVTAEVHWRNAVVEGRSRAEAAQLHGWRAALAGSEISN